MGTIRVELGKSLLPFPGAEFLFKASQKGQGTWAPFPFLSLGFEGLPTGLGHFGFQVAGKIGGLGTRQKGKPPGGLGPLFPGTPRGRGKGVKGLRLGNLLTLPVEIAGPWRGLGSGPKGFQARGPLGATLATGFHFPQTRGGGPKNGRRFTKPPIGGARGLVLAPRGFSSWRGARTVTNLGVGLLKHKLEALDSPFQMGARLTPRGISPKGEKHRVSRRPLWGQTCASTGGPPQRLFFFRPPARAGGPHRAQGSPGKLPLCAKVPRRGHTRERAASSPHLPGAKPRVGRGANNIWPRAQKKGKSREECVPTKGATHTGNWKTH